MKKIATHDSATGERGTGLLSWLVTPFAKTQSKTIREQYEAGCRMFDIRVRLVGNVWHCAHGLWISKRSAACIIREIGCFAGPCYVSLTYEGSSEESARFVQFATNMQQSYGNIHWGGIGIKYGDGSHLFNVKFDYLKPYPPDWPATEQAFLPLDGRSWHILFPIPWLWKKIYHNKPEFNDKTYKFVDFL